MHIHFNATTGRAYRDFQGTSDEILIVGVSDEQGHYILFQRYAQKQHPTDDNLYVEYNDQLHAGANCVSVCNVSKTRLELSLSSPLHSLPDVKGFDVQLHLDDTQYQDLIEALKEIFRNKEEKLIFSSDDDRLNNGR